MDLNKQMLYFKNACKSVQNINNLNMLYQYLKDITPIYYQENNVNLEYQYFKEWLIYGERSLSVNYIIESTPLFEQVILKNNIESKLEWIVYETRKYLKRRNKDFLANDLSDECKVASDKISKLCKRIDLQCKQLVIYPGFSKKDNLYNGNGYHYINLIMYNRINYIIDTTYRQFFTRTLNNLNRIGILELSNCRPGIFMTMTEERKRLAETILKKGWFVANDKNIKNYFDGFALSYRNGVYYYNTNDYTYTTKYSADDYLAFLNGSDNQINRESFETLGFQRRLITNKNNDFKNIML